MREILAIIPARGGSKSIPRKNIKLLGSKPLITYSIEAGLMAKKVGRVVVSTDDEEIANVARKFGAEVPFMRPKKLGEDNIPDLPVFQHTLKWLKEHENYVPDIVVQLRPTSPFRPPRLIDETIDILLKNDLADSVRGVIVSGQNPYKMWNIVKGRLKPLLQLSGNSEPYNSLRQKLPQTYWQTGHIDVIRYKIIMEKNSMSGGVILPIVIDPLYAVDIDTEADWSRAEWLIENYKSKDRKL